MSEGRPAVDGAVTDGSEGFVVSRRRFLSAAALVAGVAATGCAAPPPSAGANRIRGADLSFTLQLEAAGVTVVEDGRPVPVERVLARAGANVVRLRAWVDPPSGYSSLDSALRLARRAVDAGCGVHLDLHYSDFWADTRNQAVPAAWRGQDLATLADTVRRYTRHAVAAFAAQGTPLSVIQIGNEVTWGLLWPLGQVRTGTSERWDGFARLLSAGIEGAHDADPQLATMIHIERSGDPDGARHFFDGIGSQGVDFDLIGLSHYPFWHGSLDDLRATTHLLAERYGKDVVVVECAYPWTLPPDPGSSHVVSRLDQLPDGERFPPTRAGQAAWFAQLRAVLASVPSGRGAGFLAWEPAWRDDRVGIGAGAGNPYANLAMFDRAGRGLPSLGVFRG